MYKFSVEETTNDLINWIKTYYQDLSLDTKAVVGISGGKDSSVVAALLTKALGKDRVIGVLMPQGEQFDIDFSLKLVNHLEIKHVTINIKDMVSNTILGLENGLKELGVNDLSTVTTFNTPPRIRMSVLYGIAGSVNGRVVNTCNLSEDWVGYATKFGDGAGDFSLLMNLTVTEVKLIGEYLNLPMDLVKKTPIDGLCGKTDEENLGFTYEVLDQYIRNGTIEDLEVKAKIDRLRKINMHKLLPMANYNPNIRTIED